VISEEFPDNMYHDQWFLKGKKVVVHRGWTPKMQLSEDCPVTPNFRMEMNQWMLEFFGTVPDIPDGEAWAVGDSIMMNESTYQQFRSKLVFHTFILPEKS